MEVLRSNVDTRSETYRTNREGFLEQIAYLNEQLALARAGGGEKYVARHLKRGKLMARERIELLLDRDSPFLEIAPLCAWGTEFGLGGSIVSGVGVVSGVECVITASEPTVKGGSINPFSARKSGRTMEFCAQNRMPTINLTESGGADLPFQAEIFVPGGRGFRELTRRSAERIPTICLVFGSSTAGGAYVPGMSDYVVMVKEGAKVFLGGPPLVKMAINEDSDEEALGGAEMHSRVSGVSDYLAMDERDAIRIGREIVAQLNWKKLGWSKQIASEEPRYDPDELLGITSIDVRKPFDVKEIIARLVDGSRFHEFKPTYGTTLVTGYAHIHGYPVGILANNGVLFSESSEKGAVHPALQPNRHPDRLLAEHHRLHGRPPLRGRRHHQGRRQAHQRRLQLDRPPSHDHGRRVVRRRELRDVRSRVRPAVRVHVAEPSHCRHGPGAARRCPLYRAPSGRRASRGALRRGDGSDDAEDGGGSDREGVVRLLRDVAGVGRWNHRPAGYAHGAGDHALGGALERDSGDVAIRGVPDVTMSAPILMHFTAEGWKVAAYNSCAAPRPGWPPAWWIHDPVAAAATDQMLIDHNKNK